MELSLLTYNIHKGFKSGNKDFVLHEIRELIRATEVDLVFLQEVIGENKKHSDRVSGWPDQSQYEFLADEVWGEFSYGKNAVHEDGHHGNAILSRFPIKNWHNLNLSVNKREHRGLLHSEIELQAQKRSLHTCCTHLNLTKRGQVKQVEKIGEWIKNFVPPEQPLILAGDFNDWRDHASSVLRDALELDEAVKLKCGKLIPTFPSYYPLLSLDRIYVRGFEILEAEVQREKVWRKLSDHVPVVARLKLAESQS